MLSITRLLAIFTFLFGAVAQATLVEGINFAPTHSIEEQALVLNGVGIRKATIFNIKVYVAGLYLLEKSSDARSFLSDGKPKWLTMNFVRSVGKSDLTKAWDEGFVAAVPTDKLPNLQADRTQLNAWMEDLNSGDVMNFTFTAEGSVEVEIKGQVKGKIQNAEFAKSLLSVWFINPRDKGLSQGLLGL